MTRRQETMMAVAIIILLAVLAVASVIIETILK